MCGNVIIWSNCYQVVALCEMKYYPLGPNFIMWSYCYHGEQILSCVSEYYHMGQNSIIWDRLLSCCANVMVRKEQMLSCGANAIMWSKCYHVELML
jgi:hypothetical protein